MCFPSPEHRELRFCTFFRTSFYVIFGFTDALALPLALIDNEYGLLKLRHDGVVIFPRQARQHEDLKEAPHHRQRIV